MRIAVNTRLLIEDKLEGIGWFTAESMSRITKAHPEHEFFFIFDRSFSSEFVFSSNVTAIVAPPPTRHPILWWFWFEFVIPGVLKKYKIDLFVSPDGFLSLRSKVPAIPVIHDINFEHYPEQLPKLVRKYYGYFFPKWAKKAMRIGTVSEFSKQDISKNYSISPEKIDVYYNGANSMYIPASEGKKLSVRQAYTHGKPYFVFIGAMNPRKNIPGLLRAFDLFKNTDNQGFKLVIVGEKMHKTSAIYSQLNEMNYGQDVVFTGRLSPQLLNGVLGAAHALCFVPLFEGFGIPIVEAMYAEVPVICSNRSAMPEVAGDAALLVNPDSDIEISEAMITLAKDDTLRHELIRKAQIQRQKFSWDKTAQKFWETIDTCLNDITK
jgi:glycosyltransferase involved in cell wall biosynthesis